MTILEPESGKILISEPFLGDPNFTRTVVLLTEHNEEGTIGFVLNQSLDLTLKEVFDNPEIPSIPVFKGGPVELNTLHFVHQLGDKIRYSKEIKKGFYWGGSFDDASEILKKNPELKNQFKFFLGYSGWSPGQLEEELEREAWVVSSIGSKEILSSTPDDQYIWKKAMDRLGGEYRALSNSPLDPQWN